MEMRATCGKDINSFDVLADKTEQSDSSAWANWSRESSRRSAGRFGTAVENFDIASNASYDSSEASWWRGGDQWSWSSWSGSSNESRENWVYATHCRGATWDQNDPWHRWHEEQPGGLRGGEDQLSGQQVRDGREHHGLSGESEGEEVAKSELHIGKVVSIHEKAGKEEEKKLTGKLSTSCPPVFRARQGESYRDWKRSVRFGKGRRSTTPHYFGGAKSDAAVARLGGPVGQALGAGWHRKRLLALSRLPGKSLESYITMAGLYRDQLESLDASLSMGECFFVGHLLAHPSLTRRDKAMIKTHAVNQDESFPSLGP